MRGHTGLVIALGYGAMLSVSIVEAKDQYANEFNRNLDGMPENMWICRR